MAALAKGGASVSASSRDEFGFFLFGGSDIVMLFQNKKFLTSVTLQILSLPFYRPAWQLQRRRRD